MRLYTKDLEAPQHVNYFSIKLFLKYFPQRKLQAKKTPIVKFKIFRGKNNTNLP